MELVEHGTTAPPLSPERGTVVIKKIKILKYIPIKVEENVGNAARDHLANERTFLAWFRTSLALIALGAAIWRLDIFSHPQISGGICFGVGVVFSLYGTMRYHIVRKLLHQHLFESDIWGVLALVVATLSAGIAIILINVLV
jgi:putative membrane protein